MSPFGARGLNSGADDAENLAWKLALALAGRAPEALLDSYGIERRAAAVENLAITEASMQFMVPHGILRRAARNVILRGSVRFDLLRRQVNSGRLSQPFTYAASPVIAADHGDDRLPVHGAVAPDAVCRGLEPDAADVTRLLELVGRDFLVLIIGRAGPRRAASMAIRAAGLAWPAPCRIAVVGTDQPLRDVAVLQDHAGELVRIYGAAGSRGWLIRPDGHLAGSVPLDARESVDRLPALQAMAVGDPQWASPAPVVRRRLPVVAGQRARRAG